ncbi:unnamed protein product [Linum trigynum]|uniref:DUF4283 domain-containing protein n=1 Tax=Linum trigynum TaxID=586398 RepID=A0AAV2G2U0_9ROSI
MTVASQAPTAGEDHCLKPPDGSPTASPVQPSKKARANSSTEFSGQTDMDMAIVTARAEDEEMHSTEDPNESNTGAPSSAALNSGAEKTSYRDSFLGNSPPVDIPEGDDLMSDESETEDAEDDPDSPTIRIKKKTNAKICNRWRRAITFRILGRTFPFALVQSRVQRMWAKTGGLKVGDIGNGYFQATFVPSWITIELCMAARGRSKTTTSSRSHGDSTLTPISTR